MGRSKQTSSQEYAAMLCWVEVPKNLDHIVGAATKNLKSVVAGAKVTKTSAYGELAKHVNDMCEKNYQYYFLSRDKIAVNTRSG